MSPAADVEGSPAQTYYSAIIRTSNGHVVRLTRLIMRDDAALGLVRGISPETSVDDLFVCKHFAPILIHIITCQKPSFGVINLLFLPSISCTMVFRLFETKRQGASICKQCLTYQYFQNPLSATNLFNASWMRNASLFPFLISLDICIGRHPVIAIS